MIAFNYPKKMIINQSMINPENSCGKEVSKNYINKIVAPCNYDANNATNCGKKNNCMKQFPSNRSNS